VTTNILTQQVLVIRNNPATFIDSQLVQQSLFSAMSIDDLDIPQFYSRGKLRKLRLSSKRLNQWLLKNFELFWKVRGVSLSKSKRTFDYLDHMRGESIVFQRRKLLKIFRIIGHACASHPDSGAQLSCQG
jgi:hypothetical protein